MTVFSRNVVGPTRVRQCHQVGLKSITFGLRLGVEASDLALLCKS